jgi:hypothetical protein
MLLALAVIAGAGGGASARSRWLAAGAALLAFAVILAPWTVRNLEALHAFVPVTTEGGFTLAGQYNPATAADNAFEDVWQLPLAVPQVAARVQPLFRRPGGVNEAQLDAALRREGLNYLEHHPGHLAVASGFDALRMLDLGRGHAFASALAYREMAIPGWLKAASTRSAQLLWLLAAVVIGVRLTGRWRGRLGPWWLWGIPLLTFALTVPMVGNPLKRAPLDPFAILLVAAGMAAASGHARASGRSRGGSARRDETAVSGEASEPTVTIGQN